MVIFKGEVVVFKCCRHLFVYVNAIYVRHPCKLKNVDKPVLNER